MDDFAKSPGNRLVEAWLAGDDREREKIFQEIFQLYYRKVHHHLSNKGCRPDECQDLVQETFFKVHRGLPSFRREAGFETWLFQIAHNALLNHRRSRATQKREAKEVPLEAVTEGDPGPVGDRLASQSPEALDEMLAEERSEALHLAMAGLPTQMRQCVELRVQQDLRYREIAVIMQVSIDTVKAHLYQARQQLRKKLSAYFDDDDSDL